jgi:hypothetical protein
MSCSSPRGTFEPVAPGRRALRGAALAVAVAACAAHVPAQAQDALGGGNALNRDLTMPQRHGQGGGALDANTQVGGNRINPNAPKTDFFSRNLIVTGDVAGGRGFRGNVGYREQSAFTGQTGSDVNRQWDAYSALSSPSAIRSNFDAFQATQQYGAVLYSRTYSDAAARDILTNQQPLDARLAFDRFTADAMRMSRQADIIDAANTRDTAMRQNWRQEGKVIGAGTGSGSAAAGSAASGVPVDALLGSMGLNAYERQRLKQDVLSGRVNRDLIGQAYEEQAIGADASFSDFARLQPTLAPEYTSMLETMRARTGMAPPIPDAERAPKPTDTPGTAQPGPDATAPSSIDVLRPNLTPEQAARAKLDLELAWLRRSLAESGPDGGRNEAARGRSGIGSGGVGPRTTLEQGRPGMDGPAGPSGVSGAAEAQNAAQGLAQGTTQGTGGTGTQSGAKRTPQEEAQARAAELDAMAMVLRHGKRMESLVPEDAGYIRDMMQLGAESMRTGDFFRAEQRFDSVLRVIPGHPLALAGVANSQLGAGLCISAALSLRKLYARHPEMIGTRFGPDILPDAERLATALASARARLRAAMAPDAGATLAADRFDYGLLIGYIGFQQDNPAVTEEGLAAMRACRADDPLLAILERVWLPAATGASATGQPSPAAEPAPAQAAP